MRRVPTAGHSVGERDADALVLGAAASAAPAPSACAPAEPPPATAKAETNVDVPPAIRAIVDARPTAASPIASLDAGRHPGELLAFAGITPGMKVAELGAGTGYDHRAPTARTVGPTGTVFAENTKVVLEKFAGKPWGERLAKPAMKNVVRVDADVDRGLGPRTPRTSDAVFCVLVYYDIVWLGGDRDKMNKHVFDALKPGGEYVVRRSLPAKDGDGESDVKTFHRIEDKSVIDEVTRAGFRLASEASFLRNADDKRDWNASPKAAADKRGTSDRFVLKFVKP